MINQSSDEFNLNSKTSFNTFSFVNDVSNNQQFNATTSLKTQTYLQPLKIFQQQSQPLVPQQTQSLSQYQLHQFKSVNINDEIISPLSNSSSTSSSSSMSSSSSSTSSTCNNLTSCETTPTSVSNSATSTKDKNKLKIKSLNDNYVTTSSSKSSQKKLNNKKKTSQMTNDLDEERTSQLVSELLRNIKEKTKQLESLNQHMKSNHSCSNNNSSNNNSNDSKTKSNDLIANSPVNNTSSMNEIQPILNSKSFNTSNKRSRNKSKKQSNNNTSSNNQSMVNPIEIKVPNGWQRFNENSSIIYKSPTGVKVTCFQEIRNYLLAPDTCKCGLECPLNIYETFNFDINVKNMPLSSLTDLSNKQIASSCCLHKSNDLLDVKKVDEFQFTKKRKINDENHKLTLDPPSSSSSSLVYQFNDDLIDAQKLESAEFNLIQLNNDTDLNTNANLILESNYLNLNDDLDLINSNANVIVKSNDNVNNLQQLINNDLLMSSSLNSSLTNTPVLLTPHSSTSIDFSSSTSINKNNNNIFNFYTPVDDKNFDKAILRMISSDCNEIITDESLELNGTSHHFNSNVNSNQNLLTSNFIPQDLSDLCRLVND